jgi:two-component system sensor histidine kinase HydH
LRRRAPSTTRYAVQLTTDAQNISGESPKIAGMDTLPSDALGRDTSELAAEETQRLLSRLLSRLAHEIRNPLGALDVHVQLLEEDLTRISPAVPVESTARVAIIRRELSRLDNIVRQFLSLAGPSSINPQTVDLRETLQHVCHLLAPEAASREIELTATVPDEMPPLSADHGQLTQALVNLALNAIQAIQRSGRVQMIAQAEDARGGIAIEVRDSGPGIDLEKRAAIFEPFFTTKPEGSGLGLWIVQQIAMAHGGTVTVTNAPEGGAVFALHLPLQPRNRTP